MSLTASEQARIKFELGFHLLSVDAEPDISWTSLFDLVVFPNITTEGEAIVREILDSIASTKEEMSLTYGEGALKQVDEVHFYQTGGTLFGNLGGQLAYWREELASALGVE